VIACWMPDEDLCHLLHASVRNEQGNVTVARIHVLPASFGEEFKGNRSRHESACSQSWIEGKRGVRGDLG
jgi:hypothetical protein